VHGVRQAETAATSTLAHVQQFAVASTAETSERSVTCHARRHHCGTEDTAKEITHEDVEMLRRFAAAFLTVVFELPMSDVTVVDGEKAVLECRVAVTPAAVVTWYVDTSFTVRGLRAGTDYYFRVIAENGALQPLTLDHSFVPRTPYDKPSAPRGPLEVSDVTRSSVTLSWLAPTSNGGAAIVTYVIERPEHLSPTWTHVARVRPQTDANLAERTDYQFRVCVESVEICQTDGHRIVFTADG